MRIPTTNRSAFTAVELVVVLAVLATFLWLLMPTAGRGCKRKSTAVACQNNLKQIALAFIVWVNDREQSAPPFRVGWWGGGSSPEPAGQTKPNSSGSPPAWATSDLANNAWFQFAWISNELNSPRILACPSDKLKRAAENFSADVNGGFLHVKFQDKAVSYLLSLDCGYRWTGAGKVTSWETAPQSLLVGDRNLGFQASDGSLACASGIRGSGQIALPAKTHWTPQAKHGHGESGNLALIDGSAASARSSELKDYFQHDNDAGRVHLLGPR